MAVGVCGGGEGFGGEIDDSSSEEEFWGVGTTLWGISDVGLQVTVANCLHLPCCLLLEWGSCWGHNHRDWDSVWGSLV